MISTEAIVVWGRDVQYIVQSNISIVVSMGIANA